MNTYTIRAYREDEDGHLISTYVPHASNYQDAVNRVRELAKDENVEVILLKPFDTIPYHFVRKPRSSFPNAILIEDIEDKLSLFVQREMLKEHKKKERNRRIQEMLIAQNNKKTP